MSATPPDERVSPTSLEPAITDVGGLSHFSEAEVNATLRILALNGGRVKPTIEQLEAAELPSVSVATLNRWRDTTFRTRYFEIRRDMAGDVSEELAGRSLERAMQADEVQAEALERLSQRVSELDVKDLAPTIRNLAQSKSSDIEKAQLLRDRPTEIKEHRTVGELMHVLNSVPNLIEGELVEDAEVVEDEDE